MPLLSIPSSEDPIHEPLPTTQLAATRVYPDGPNPLPSNGLRSYPLGGQSLTPGPPSRKSSGRAAYRQKTPAQQEVLSWIEEIIVPALVENFIRMKSSQEENRDE